MSIYLTRAHYSQESFKGMTAKPEDREVAAKAMFGAAGMKLHNMWYSGNGEVICVVEGTVVSGAAGEHRGHLRRGGHRRGHPHLFCAAVQDPDGIDAGHAQRRHRLPG